MSIPAKLGKYDILRELGQGAMGIVYEGRDPVIDRRVAIKTLKREQLAKRLPVRWVRWLVMLTGLVMSGVFFVRS